MFSISSPDRFTLARWVFARALGAIFFCAFVSLGLQIRGLAGEHGIIPAQQFLDAAWNQLGAGALWQVPTLCWLNASDTMLVALCLSGVALSIALMCGVFPGLCALLLWALYLSLCWIATPFTNFQWDALLLETALAATLLFPWQWRPQWGRWRPAQQAGLWLLWWLVFRLMVESGAVKLSSHDATWLSLTALDYHFETQPLPLWTAWFASQIPDALLCLATFIMFVIELAAPLLIVAPRRWRHAGAWALIGLQVIILATGNYAFFNLLTITLCLSLFDDDGWPARLKSWVQIRILTTEAWTPLSTWLLGPVLALVFLVTVQPLLSSLGLVRRWPVPFSTLNEAVQPWMSLNGYGLFRVMTTSRHEISVEGSDDGVHWREYEFRWKPGDLNERPGLVAPHQPRLDWQMWFAALSNLQDNRWFVPFLVRLLEGSPEVLGLLRHDPFPSHPPRYIRAVVYDYHFTRFGDGHPGWWKRELLGLYCPPITLKNGRPTLAEPAPK
ncbi:MAG: lipase maturation factor family protein [Chthoniobacter sp.]|uniref:lipase maturation factor family protein n=1 Tax=Chthoniobacter sp. TaxID=2510640 RepID=UPI0032A3FFF7